MGIIKNAVKGMKCSLDLITPHNKEIHNLKQAKQDEIAMIEKEFVRRNVKNTPKSIEVITLDDAEESTKVNNRDPRLKNNDKNSSKTSKDCIKNSIEIVKSDCYKKYAKSVLDFVTEFTTKYYSNSLEPSKIKIATKQDFENFCTEVTDTVVNLEIRNWNEHNMGKAISLNNKMKQNIERFIEKKMDRCESLID